MSAGSTPGQAGTQQATLRVADVAAFSVGMIGPVGVMALLGSGAAGLLGAGAVWAFVFALVGVGLVGQSFVGLSRYISHTGSAYALVGLTLGPRAGVVAGWCLAGAYLAIGVGASTEISLFVGHLLGSFGVTLGRAWLFVVLAALAAAACLAFTRIRTVTRSLLYAEILGLVLVTVLSVVIFVRLGIGATPPGHTEGGSVFALPAGSGIGTVAAASVFGFLAFAGFEGAAALGEETREPRRQIPRALVLALAVVGTFYLITIVAQVLGYGTGPDGVRAFQSSESPYGDLAGAWIGPVMADVLDVVAAISLFAILLGVLAAAARVLYALARDAGGAGPVRALARLSGSGEPVTALLSSAVVVAGAALGQWLAGVEHSDAVYHPLTLATIALLVTYVLVVAGALRFLHSGPRPRRSRVRAVVPLAALAFLGYTIYYNVVGQEPPASWFPVVVVGWILVALVPAIFVPGLAARVRRNLRATLAEPAEPDVGDAPRR